MNARTLSLRNLLLVLLALVLVNLLGHRYHVRKDLTGDERYTLSAATTEMLDSLPEAVTVTAYFTEDLPPDLAMVRQDLKDLLVEYAERSKGNVVFAFVDPNSADSLEKQANESGVRWVLVNTREKDKAEQLKVYMGAVVQMGEQTAIIPVLQPGSSLEWELSSAMKRVSIVDKPAIGLIQGHGEPAMGNMPQLEQALSVLYAVEPMAIYDSFPIHDRFSALIWIDPKDSIPAPQLKQLEAFMAKGRGLVLASSNLSTNVNTSNEIAQRRPELADWLARRGVVLEPRVVIDANCGQVQVLQQRGQFTMPVPVMFPYFPIISGYSSHPVSSGLDAVVLQFTSPMSFIGDSSRVKWTPLLFTSKRSNSLPAPQVIDIQKQWNDMDFLLGPQTVSGALEGQLTNGQPSRMVVVGNGGFVLNGNGQQPMQIEPDNVNLIVNAVDWTTDRTGLIELRNKGVGYRPLDEVSDEKRALIKWAMLLVPVLLVLGYGAFRLRWRKKQREQRMQADHVQ